MTQTPEGRRGSGPEDARAVWSGSSPGPAGQEQGELGAGRRRGLYCPHGGARGRPGVDRNQGLLLLTEPGRLAPSTPGANVFQNPVQGLKLLLPVHVCLAPPVSLRLWILTPFRSSAFLCVLSATFSGKALNPVSMEHALGICHAPGLLRYFISGVTKPQAAQQEVSSGQATEASLATPHRSPSLALPPETSPPHCPWKNSLPQNQSLVPKRLGPLLYLILASLGGRAGGWGPGVGVIIPSDRWENSYEILLLCKLHLFTDAHLTLRLNWNQALLVTQLPGQPPPGVPALPPTLSVSLGPEDKRGPSTLPSGTSHCCRWQCCSPFQGRLRNPTILLCKSCHHPGHAKGTSVQPQPPVQGRQRRSSLFLPHPASQAQFRSPLPTGPPLPAPALRDVWSTLFSFSHVTQGPLLTSAFAACESHLSNQAEALW